MPFLLSLSLLVAAGFGALVTTASAQDGADDGATRPRTLVGPTASINWNDHMGGFRATDVSGCAEFENGNGFGFGLGLSASFHPGPGSGWSINPAISYEERPAKHENFIVGTNGVVGTWSGITYTVLSTEIMFGQEVARIGDAGFGIRIGPAVQYVLSGRIEQQRLTDEGAMPCIDGGIPDLNPTRFFAKLGAEASFVSGNGWIVSPGLFYERGLTGVRESEDDWKVHSLIFQIGVLIPVW